MSGAPWHAPLFDDDLAALESLARHARGLVAGAPLPPADWQGLAEDCCGLLAEVSAELGRRRAARAGASAVILAWRPRGAVR